MTINFAPTLGKFKVKSIALFGQSISKAVPGDLISFEYERDPVTRVRRGNVAIDASEPLPKAVSFFVAQILILQLPGWEQKIDTNYRPIIDIGT